MLVSIFGDIGSGKTLLLTSIAYLNQDSGKKIVANYVLKGIEYEEFDFYKMAKSEYDNAIILIDEAYIYIDSRNYTQSSNKLFSYALFQSRKKTVELYLTMQLFRTIDVRFRMMSSYVINCEQIEEGFEYTLMNPKIPDVSIISVLNYENALMFYEMYNTNEVIAHDSSTFMFLSNEERQKNVEKYAKEIYLDYKKVFYEKHDKEDKLLVIKKHYVNRYTALHNIENNYNQMIFDEIRTKYFT